MTISRKQEQREQWRTLIWIVTLMVPTVAFFEDMVVLFSSNPWACG